MKLQTAVKSVCPVCLKEISGVIQERDGLVFMLKECVEHGKFEKRLSDNAGMYFDARNFFTTLIKPDYKRNKKLLYVSEVCNLDCPICCFRPEENVVKGLSFEDIENLAKKDKSELILFAMEPSCRSDIFEIIAMLKKNKKSVPLYTNGLKIADMDFLKKLKASGVDKVVMQFDGFQDEIYKDLRGGDKLLSTKLKALDNLRELGVPTIINDTVMKGSNDRYMKDVFEYAVKNSFVSGAMFIGYTAYGKVVSPEKTLESEELVSLLEKQTGGKISLRNVSIFQKLLYVYLNILKDGICIHLKNYWVYRKNGDYIPVDAVMDMEKLDRFLNIYLDKFYKKNKKLSGIIYLAVSVLRSLKNYRLILLMVVDGLKIVLGHISKKAYYSKEANGFLQVNFSTACDPYRVDYDILDYCEMDLVYKRKEEGVRCQRQCEALMDFWRKGSKGIMAV